MEFSEQEFDEILNIFQQESEEILQRIDANLLSIEKDPANKDILLTLFREAHSLKGSARMLGFDNIQNIAHKIEDVLGLAKDEKIKINQQILDTISKAVVFIGILVKKSLESKKEFYSPEVLEHMHALEAVSGGEKQNIELPLPAKSLKGQSRNIDAFISEIIFNFTKLQESFEPSLIENLCFNATELSKILKIEGLDEIINKLSQADKNNFSQTDVVFLDEKINLLVKNVQSLYTENNIPVIDYYSAVSKKFENKEKTAQEHKHIYNDEFLRCAKFVDDNILALENNPQIFPSVKENLSFLSSNAEKNDLKSIYSASLTLLNTFAQKNKSFDNEILKALKQIISSVTGCLPGGAGNSAVCQDLGLLLQRLVILQHMADLSINQIQVANNEEIADTKRPKTEYSQDWYKVFDQAAIKTLRVDSSKLDKLVSQIAELIITKIKYQEHASQVEKLNYEANEWYKETHKIGHYIKHFDRKYLQNANNDIQSLIGYNRQLMNMFNENGRRFDEFVHRTEYLYKIYADMNAKLALLANDIEDMVKSMRILPLATIFHMFPRMVRNISKEQGKEIDFQIAGSETSADKKIIEEVKISLMHIVRNSIGHGIEMPEERIKKGKPPEGKILIDAKHQEGKIVITVQDDGGGIDLKKIKQRAVSRGFLSTEEADSMNESELMNLIFYPGFSTGEAVDDISGRGLGLDIVREKILQLDGKIDVISEVDRGTSVKIELPASMATIKVFIIKENSQYFAIPMGAVKKVLRIDSSEFIQKDGKNAYIYEDETVFVYTLAQILELDEPQSRNTKQTMLVIEQEGLITGVIVQELCGDQEILHKKLSPPLLKVKNVSGITTLASGETCLILNVIDILKENSTKKLYPKLVTMTEERIKNLNSSYKILVIDDSITTRTLEKNILITAGYHVDLAIDGLDGYNRIINDVPDLIITDNEMPNMSGIDLVKKLKDDEKYKNIPIIVVTSLSRDIWENDFFNLGIDKYIQKNEFDQAVLLDNVRRLLKSKDEN